MSLFFSFYCSCSPYVHVLEHQHDWFLQICQMLRVHIEHTEGQYVRIQDGFLDFPVGKWERLVFRPRRRIKIVVRKLIGVGISCVVNL